MVVPGIMRLFFPEVSMKTSRVFSMANGHYSLIQYCPDRFRAEAVNVGLVVMCAEPLTVRVRLTSTFKRACDWFGITEPDLVSLKIRTDSIRCRIEKLETLEDLLAFASSRANDLRLTKPRFAKIQDMDADFERLFSQLVD